ncbi:MAG TPA: 1-(5-phosphoribosyl)-5-[(5-phosphoribosylamino)methylideneamino]imidazole-4-carboxamide isomerase [Solirubrobacteraceae bacterium]|nr:1-(5-phosphoribosyl)-5-[(5-phosphoribosylamino)methylideneamino]imidazole-4-carboxamide isomerase [Solirubrobacteraceae bacterium]
MILYPAIDILDGRAVRLEQGRFEEPTVYAEDPMVAAHGWVSQGAQALHVVDLDGARAGEPVNVHHVRAIIDTVDVPVQVGGGLRSTDDVAEVLEAGATRVVVGTAAHSDAEFLDDVLTAHGESVAVAVDVRDGLVSAAGWTESTEQAPDAVLRRLAAEGVRTVIYTDVDRDGMLTGPDVDTLTGLLEHWPGRLLYSGGIGSLAHLEALAPLPLDGVIVGKALYEERFTIVEAQEALAR